ncbi:hypothetical protein FEM48_Zijuj08G0040500 [Ziziphus jujuba var. spinosa]|uniref:Embryo defective 1703 n=1 Tax=Ziziphus jujuba var. spinosa TaxID=714518 RepID=A0A978UWW1_ZIZJJ|nr:hypothetical protein FEM48_Zijuj08G0040500 [Ziziphus jujuba var. spinosa]
MEVLSSSAPTNLKSFSFTSPFTPIFPTKSWDKKNQFRYNIPSSIFHRNSRFSICLPLANRSKFLVLAHFGRPTNRRNSLRKKLIDEQKVRHDPIPLCPTSDFQPLNRNFSDNESFLDKESDTSNGVADNNAAEKSSAEESKSKRLGDSVLMSKLENWVEQYKKDSEYWGIGSEPVFTVFQDSNGNTKRVSINEDEIFRRNQVEQREFEDLSKVNLKILYAKNLAREMESGKNVIPRNSSVAKFVIQGQESGLFRAIQGFTLQPNLREKLPKVGSMVLYAFIALWALKKLFTSGNKEVQYTELEKEMVRRKIKSRKEKEMLESVSVEVVKEPFELPMASIEKPRLDKQLLMESIEKAKSQNSNLTLLDSSSSAAAKSVEFDDKIQEIRKMAKQARSIEAREQHSIETDEEGKQTMNTEFYEETEEGKEYREQETKFPSDLLNRDTEQNWFSGDNGFQHAEAFVDNRNFQDSSSSHVNVSAHRQTIKQDLTEHESVVQTDDASFGESCDSRESSVQVKPWVIKSVKEAREYLSEKRRKGESNHEAQFEGMSKSDTLSRPQSDEQCDGNTIEELSMEDLEFPSAFSDGTSGSPPSVNASNYYTVEDKEFVAVKNDNPKGEDIVQKQQLSLDQEGNDSITERKPSVQDKNWLEKNYNEIDPIFKKIGVGFRDNYMVAREKENQVVNVNLDMRHLGSIGDDSELEWMKNDSLAEIVFKVRENELAGRDPFHMLNAEDKLAFFNGLEKKVERENEKLLKLHEWLHSNIENLDYGADGISLYDPPEKIIPRWKGPHLEKSPEFINDFLEQRKEILDGNARISYPVNKDEQNFLQKSTESPPQESIAASSAVNYPKKQSHGDLKSSKTIIESSDGSARAGKKSGKEFWQHTKKWSQGFLESYNAETDPEVKSTMRDIGKDLDRWITEKEIQEAADLMNKLPERNKEFMEKKLSKLKREMELFGPQAVVSKYREYAEDKEEDYLWWLDLPHILCIELYTVENGEQRIGFYSLEMAPDLELEPKPYHVISFEDSNDCKNLCYIIQAQMDMLDNGHAFVVPRPPKDAFREAKANGFSITVIRKGELQLNVDQTLEEVEEQIIEIGSKIYHDKIMQERSVDISSLMKGVFGFKSKPMKRKGSKQKLKKPRKK